MTGRYLIYTPVHSVRYEKRFDAAWSKFAEVCRSLSRDGLSYIVLGQSAITLSGTLENGRGIPPGRTGVLAGTGTPQRATGALQTRSDG